MRGIVRTERGQRVVLHLAREKRVFEGIELFRYVVLPMKIGVVEHLRKDFFR
jgi:hypothetical protein